MDKEREKKEKERGSEPYTLSEIQQLMVSARQQQIGRLKIRQDGFSLEIEIAAGPVTTAEAAAGTGTGVSAQAMTSVEHPEPDGSLVKSPIVGTFYEAPSPDAAPFVKEGDMVRKGDVIFIIESMKLMNEVVSDREGTVSHIHVKNAEGVEYGQPIMTIV